MQKEQVLELLVKALLQKIVDDIEDEELARAFDRDAINRMCDADDDW